MPAEVIATSTLHQGWTRLLRVRVRLPDGKEIDREVEDHGRAVAVLPYDPARRAAMLIRLLRAPVLLTTGAEELLEAPAGLVDETEPADTARRELYEETGLKVQALEHLARVWTLPGISTERMDLYLARYSKEDRVGPGGGLDSENENISVVEMPLDEVWARIQDKTITDMKTMALILFLRTLHPQLFTSGESAG